MEINAITVFVLIYGLIVGWLIADLAFINGVEPKGKFNKNFIKYLWPINWKWFLLYIFASAISGLICIYTLNSFSVEKGVISNIALFAEVAVGYVLLHAAIVDIACFQIYVKPIIFPLIIIFLANILLAVTGNPNNIIAGAIAAIFMYLIIKVSKKRGMGEGDLLIFILMGLTLGLTKLIVAFYVMTLIGSVVGLAIAVKKKKFKGTKIPFVPFMMLGYIVALLWGNYIVYSYLSAFLYY